MKRLPLVVALALFVTVLAQAETPSKTIDLLAEKSLSAWEFVTATPTEIGTVATFGADGTLAIVGKPVGYLATKTAYENYQLHVEWRWPANAAKNSNSGVLLHSGSGPTGGTAWPICFQMQMKLGRAGDLLPMGAASFAEKLSTPPDAKTPQLDRVGDSVEKPLGSWNTCEITCRGDVIEVTVNGVPQNRISKSAPAVGKIGLQLEGTPFDVRAIRLSPAPTAIGNNFQFPPANSSKPAGKFE